MVGLLIERETAAPNRASSPSALNEVTCSLAYGDANRATIGSSYILCADSPRQPTSSSDDDYPREDAPSVGLHLADADATSAEPVHRRAQLLSG